MSRGKDDTSFLANLFSVRLFKRTQGRLVRRLTAIAVSAVALIGCYLLSIWLQTNTDFGAKSRALQLGIPFALALLSLWGAFRLVHHPPFANFLVSVEAEMDKVSWADAAYLKRATGVVVGTMVFLGTVLWMYDFFWFRLFSLIHILDADALQGK